MTQWLFDASERARRGGSAAEYAFTPGLSTFVREVLQNAKDQHAGSEHPVKVDFSMLQLSGESLQSFMKAIDFLQLEDHLKAAGAARKETGFLRALKQMHDQDSLLLLRVDDSGTRGLTGGDLEGDSAFVSLCIDELFSSKQDKGAGGSYGLGKSVLWRFSSFSTVIFSSYPETYPEDGSGLRIFGRAQLPWHELNDKSPFSGAGWLGAPGEYDGRPAAMSWWGRDSQERASGMHLDRPDKCGTSILIVGFTPPADERIAHRELCQNLTREASRHFWPVLSGANRSLQVSATLKDLERGENHSYFEAVIDSDVQPMADCLDAFRAQKTVEHLEKPGQVARVDIPFTVPARHDGEPAINGSVALCVRLSNKKTGKLTHHLAEFRGFGMVVRYRNFEGLSLSARPFHACLICGTAHGDSEADLAIEDFLRTAEPPEHDRWASNKRLKETYKAGYDKALKNLEKEVRQKLKQIVSESAAGGEDGPKLLSKMFPLSKSGPQSRKHPFAIKQNHAQLTLDGRWLFGTTIERQRSEENARPWEARIKMLFGSEDGASEISVIGEIEPVPGCTVTIRKGVATIQIPKNVTKVSVSGRTDPDLHPVEARRAAAELAVSASFRKESNA